MCGLATQSPASAVEFLYGASPAIEQEDVPGFDQGGGHGDPDVFSSGFLYSRDGRTFVRKPGFGRAFFSHPFPGRDFKFGNLVIPARIDKA
jgi:hypothetical protein